jgi:type IV pilus assembly protein PilF
MSKLNKLCISGIIISLMVSGCVSINTGQPAKNPQIQQQEAESAKGDKKISLDEAANFNMTLGAQYLKQNNLGQAIVKLEKAVEQKPTLALAHTYLGFAYEQYGEISKARDHYSKSIKLDPDDPIALNNFGTFLCRQNEHRASLAYFEKAANNRRYQTPDAAYANAGICAKKIPDMIAADNYFRSALKSNPKLADAQYHLADINLEMNNLIIAQSFFNEYKGQVKDIRETPDFLWLGYRLEKQLGNPNEAGQYALKLQQLYPTSEQTKKLLDRNN